VAGNPYDVDRDYGAAAAMNWRKWSWYRAEAGAAAVEAALIMGVLVLMIAGSIEFAQALWTNNTMLLAVEQAGRYAMVHNKAAPTTCAAQKQASHCPVLTATPLADCAASWAEQVLSSYQAPNIGVSASEDTTSTPNTMTICASYSFNFIAPRFFPEDSLDLTARVTVPLI
jgi:Flp pilus assembly protein TadG